MKQCCACGSAGHSSPNCPMNKKDGCKFCGAKRECSRIECPLRKPVTVDCPDLAYERSNGGFKRRTGLVE